MIALQEKLIFNCYHICWFLANDSFLIHFFCSKVVLTILRMFGAVLSNISYSNNFCFSIIMFIDYCYSHKMSCQSKKGQKISPANWHSNIGTNLLFFNRISQQCTVHSLKFQRERYPSKQIICQLTWGYDTAKCVTPTASANSIFKWSSLVISRICLNASL